MFFKGVAAQAQTLRPLTRSSSDVDVLVRPGHLARLLDLAYQSGWKTRFLSENIPHVLPGHSVTLVHPNWPNDIDVHAFLPGVVPGPEEVFEFLWPRRAEATIAGCEVSVPRLPDHITMLGINAMRAPEASASKTELAFLAQLLHSDQQLAAEWIESRDRLRTRTQLSSFSSLAGIDPGAPDLSPAELRTWDLFRDSENGTGALRYFQQIARPRNVRELGRTIVRIFWKPLAELRLTWTDPVL